tara:strand:+ start:119 stop:340 length:222 start_codon:yes stop_codon:yes gene_type:complete
MSKEVVITFMLVLFVLHQDFWFRDDATLILGILPIGLAYHMAFTVLAATAWLVIVRFAWPKYLEEEENEGNEQ